MWGWECVERVIYFKELTDGYCRCKSRAAAGWADRLETQRGVTALMSWGNPFFLKRSVF